MANDDVHLIRSGPRRGCLLRIRDEAPEIRGADPSLPWQPAPLRELARAYAVGEGPWPWLRERGIRRPTPSGTQTGEADRSRQQVKLRLSVDDRAELDALAARWGCSLSEAVARAVREAR